MSSLDPSGAVQIDAEHPSRNRKVEGSNPSSGSHRSRSTSGRSCGRRPSVGRFVVFGHGGCLGDEGHCEVPSEPRARTDLRLAHPLTPQTELVTVADALRRILAEQEKGLRQVTLVPVSKDPNRQQRGPTDSLFRFDGLQLQTYLTETEEVSTSA